jgi:Uncharacterized conserved protein (DUF2249)
MANSESRPAGHRSQRPAAGAPPASLAIPHAQAGAIDMSSPEAAKTIVDVRELAPRERHPLIFGSLAQLTPGEALMLINDHDSKPL